MPNQALVFKPGINRLATAYNNEGSYYEGDRIRFRDGRPQPIGGWQDRGLIGDLQGICRTKKTWRTNNGAVLEAFGTSQGLWVNSDGTLYDITPVDTAFTSVTNVLSTTNGSAVITVGLASAHNSSVGNRVELSGFDLTTQGISNTELNDTHTITGVPDANTVEITLDETATATAASTGGTGNVDFLISPGAEGTVFGNGWGAGRYGISTYGTPRTSFVASSRARVWSLDNWGEILVGTYRNGTPVKWDPTNDGLTVRASVITNAPKADHLLVSSPDRHLVLFGSVLPGETEINRLCIRWSDQENYNEWTITATTTAGYSLLGSGSEILSAQASARQIIIWTDTAISSMQYIGPPFTFGVQQLDYTTEIASRNASVEVDGTVLWMGSGSFYVYDGIARVLPCPIKDIVFDNYNIDQKEKFFGAVNQTYHEAWWFYVSANATEIDSYVVFDYVNQIWYYGSMARTAWEDAGLNDYPTSISPDNVHYNHELGRTDDGSPLGAYIESAPFDIGEGDFLMYVKEIIPDAKVEGTGDLQIYIKGRRYPNATEQTYGPYTVDEFTQRIRTRLRMRQISFRYESPDTDIFWQAGKPRLEIKPQGKY